MRTITETINLYAFNELSEKAKAKAIAAQKESDIKVNFNFLEEDLREFLYEKYGIESPRLGWSLSYCQGDGLHFDCENILTDKITALAYAKMEADDIKTIKKLIKDGLTVYTKSSNYRYQYASKYDIQDNSAYIDLSEEERKTLEAFTDIIADIYLDICKECEKIGYSIYDETDEQAIESIEANEYDFLEDGSIY